MAVLSTLLDFVGISSLPSRPLSPADFYTLVLISFKTWPLLVPILAKINAPHGKFSFDSILNVNGNLGWLLMEIPSPIMFLLAVSSSPLSTVAPKDSFSLMPRLDSLLSPSLSNFLALPSANQVLAILYLTHYTHRAVLSPLRSPPRSPMHLSVPFSALAFNLINGFLMGSWIGGRSPWSALPSAASASAAAGASKLPRALAQSKLYSWVSSKVVGGQIMDRATLAAPGVIPNSVWSNPLWYLGLAGWLVGFAGNVYHDEILMDLRRPKKDAKQQDDDSISKGKGALKYSIPRGGLYEYVSYPNYLCEWFEWFSYALAAVCSPSLFDSFDLSSVEGVKQSVATLISIPPFLFGLVEICVMLPRAVNGHAWYKKTFGDRYPKNRKAALPFLL